MRLSLHTALLALAFANTLVDPVDAVPVHAAKRHLKRATGGFHQSALRHSAGLARDLRVALRGLGVGSPAHLAVRDDDSGSGVYCVPVPDGYQNTNHTHTAHSSPVATTTNRHPSSVTSSSTPSSTAVSNFQLAESYVRVKFHSVCHRPANFFSFFVLIVMCSFRSPGTRFSRDGPSSRVPTLPMEM
jgi:hypothetical protein